MKNLNDFVDDSFDEDFKKLDDLKWLPWVGKDYRNTAKEKRLLIVGESHYEWKPNAGETQEQVREWINDRMFTRNFIERDGLQMENYAPNEAAKVVINLEKAVFPEGITPENKRTLWRSSAYFNIIQEPLSARNDRGVLDFETGWNVFFKVLEILQPAYCLFCGLAAANEVGYFNDANNKYQVDRQMWKNNREDKIGGAYPRIVLLFDKLNNEAVSKLVFIKHPSRHFSDIESKLWQQFIKEHII